MSLIYKKFFKQHEIAKKNSQKPCRHQLRQAQNLVLQPSPNEENQSDDIVAEGSVQTMVPKTEGDEESLGPCSQCKKEKHDKRVYRWKLITGLLLPYFLASVDLTIVAAALPFIASHFSEH